MNTFSHDPVLITYADLKRMFMRHFPLMRRIALLCAAIALGIALLRAPLYRAEATFKQAGMVTDLSSNMKEIFQQILPASAEKGTLAIMCSNEMLKDVVQTTGLQMECDPDFALTKVFKRIKDNLRSEVLGSLSEMDNFHFADVCYLGEKTQKFLIQFTGNGAFTVSDSQKKILAQGAVGVPVTVDGVKFTLTSTPKTTQKGKWYSLYVRPWLSCVAQVRSHFAVHPLKTDKHILQLSFTDRDRHLAASVLNQVMRSYQKYLKRENEELCQSQLDYLKGRQQELVAQFDQALAEHADYLVESLDRDGFIGFSQELETLSAPKNHYLSQLFDVDVELKRFLSVKDPMFARAALRNHKKQKLEQTIDLRDSLFEIQSAEHQKRDELQLEQDRQVAIEHLLHKQKILDEDFIVEEQDFAGLSLDTAQSLMVEYTQQRDKMQAEMVELTYLRKRLVEPDFELSSLGAVLNEPVTNDLIQKASAIALQLQDSGNRSEREQERLVESLRIQKSFLSQYIFQTVELKKLKTQLLEDKIAALHLRIIDLLKSEKHLIGQKLQDINTKMKDIPEKWRRESLLMLNKEIGAMMVEAISQLTETKFLGQNIFQVSSKPLDSALPPGNPQKPALLWLSLFAALAGAAGCYVFQLGKALTQGLPATAENLKLSGFPVCGTLSRYCATHLSQMKEGDLETLRGAAEFLTGLPRTSDAIAAVCVGGKYPNYTQALAEMLAMRGLKVLVMHCVFDKTVTADQRPGLWQYLHGETDAIPMRHPLHYDEILSGGTTRHAAELIHHAKFSDLMATLKTKYDLILIFASADAARVEGLSYLKVADAAIVSVQNERKQDLMPYCEWARKKGVDCTTFVYAEE